MPLWAQVVAWALGAIVAVITIIVAVWTKVVVPLAELLVLHRRVEPSLRKIADAFGGDEDLFHVLREIGDQFKTDSGSSLRDMVNGLAESSDRMSKSMASLVQSAHENKVAAEVLKVGVEAVKQLAATDRSDAMHRQRQIEELSTKVDSAAGKEKP